MNIIQFLLTSYKTGNYIDIGANNGIADRMNIQMKTIVIIQ